MEIKRPQNIPPYAEACLQALSTAGLGHHISLGGAFALLHYHDYRTTHDIDAWWQPEATAKDKEAVISTIVTTLESFGTVRLRSWQEVTSIELDTHRRKEFSFQIADRSVQLEPSLASPWQTIPLDSLDDLVASKMVALVERGAPRDFVDIFTVCQNNLVSPNQCWQLWEKRQRLATENPSRSRAILAILTHLARIEQQRPLSTITDQSAKELAIQVRTWFKEEFAHDPTL